MLGIASLVYALGHQLVMSSFIPETRSNYVAFNLGLLNPRL